MAERLQRPRSLATPILSPAADLDFSATYTYTEQAWDNDQAEQYALFLKSHIQHLALNPTKGRPVADRTGLFTYVVRWKGARHGHRIVYEETPTGIYVLRILHTDMHFIGHVP